MKKILVLFSFLLGTFHCFSQTGWQLIYSFPEDVGAICFIDNNIGFAGSGISASTKKIMKTTDAGNSWNDLIITNNTITRIYFYNYNLGFAIGENGTIYKTTDSGINWNLISLGETETFRGIYFLSEQIGWICVGSDKVIKTTNGGNNWGSSFTSGCCLLKTTNGGVDWILETFPERLFEVIFINQNIGWAVGSYGEVYPNYYGIGETTCNSKL